MNKVRLVSYSRPSSRFLPNFPLFCSASTICEIDNGDGAPPQPPSPRTLSPLILIGDEDDNDRYCFYSLSGAEKITRIEKNQKSWRRKELRGGARLVGSSKGWIASINPSNCSLYLSNPLSPKTSPIIPLPPIETLPVVTSRHFTRRRIDQSSENPYDFYNSDPDCDDGIYDKNEHDAGVAAYESSMTNYFDTSFMLRNHPSLSPALVPAEKLSKEFVRKVAMSSEPPSPSNGYANWDKCAVAIIYGYMYEPAELALCILGDSGWTPLNAPLEEYVDILFSKHNYKNGKLVLFALSFVGAIESYEFCFNGDDDHHPLSRPRRSVVKMSPPKDPPCYKEKHRERYLVETSSGDLLIVRNFMDIRHCADMEMHQTLVSSPLELDVHWLDMKERKWVRVECLGDDEALFVSREESVLMSVGEFSGLRPNCIYFMDGDHVGVFSLQDKTIVKQAFDYAVNFLGKEDKPLPFWLVPNSC